MDDVFFAKSNFEMLYTLMDENLIKNFSLSLDQLPINARSLIYDGMVEAFTSHSQQDSLEDVNKKVLKMCVPLLASHVSPQKMADDKVKVFVKSEDSPVLVGENKELLEGTVLHKEKNSSNEKNTHITTKHYDLDISSADRTEWSTHSSDTPYEFVVHLGSSDTTNGIVTPTTFHNVVAVNITHAIIPDTQNNKIDKYPFLYLQIDELPGVYESTSDHGRKSFVKLIRDKQWSESSTNNVRYNLMNTKGTAAKPSVGWVVDTPTASLSKLTLRLVSPNGYDSKTILMYLKSVGLHMIILLLIDFQLNVILMT